MPVSGLVATVEPSADVEAVRLALGREPAVQLGKTDGRRIPLVVDTPDPQTDKRVWQRLNAVPGLLHLDVVFVGFDEDRQPDCQHNPALEIA